jgi:cytochrome c-type biogenesis protein CcmH
MMLRVRTALLTAVVVILGSMRAFAVDPGEALADPRLEARARGLSAELRCLVCQNQSIDDSNAPLARDLRRLVRERIAGGDTDRAVMTYVVDRYGEFVLLRPPLGWHTALLWGTPLFVLGLTIWLLLRRRPGGGALGATAALNADERRSLAELLKRDG